MADKAEVFEHNQTAFVVEQHLKVMLEEDYLALQKPRPTKCPSRHWRKPAVQRVQTRTKAPGNNHAIWVPKLSKKSSFPNSKKKSIPARISPICVRFSIPSFLPAGTSGTSKQALLNQVYADKVKVKGIDLNDPTVKQRIYEQYLKAYKKGVFNYIKEDVTTQGGPIPRKYFSAGLGKRRKLSPQPGQPIQEL